MLTKQYDHVSIGIKKSAKTVIGMIASGADIIIVNGKQYNMLTVLLFC